jgi:hypothetical protein
MELNAERRELSFLEYLVKFINAKTVVEIGVQFGEAAVHLCHAANVNNGKYIGFDVWNSDPEFFKIYGNCGSKELVAQKLESNGLHNFTLNQIDTIHNRNEFNNQLNLFCPNGVDFAFIDGNHSYFGVANDFFAIYPRLASTGVIAFHDTAKIDGCREFIFDLRTKYNDGTFDISDYPFGYGARNCGVTLLTKRSYSSSPISIDEICGSISEANEIELKEIEWLKNETQNKPQIPKIFEEKILVNKIGFYKRNKFEKI